MAPKSGIGEFEDELECLFYFNGRQVGWLGMDFLE